MPASMSPSARLQLLYEVTALGRESLAARIDTALSLVTRALRLEIGILSRIEGDRYTVSHVYAPGGALLPGQMFDLSQTYCALIIETGSVISIGHAETSPYAQHPCRELFGLESYIGAVIEVRGQRIGTLNFSSSSPRDAPFREEDEALVVMLARWIGAALETQLAEAERAEGELRFRGAFDYAAIGMAMVAPDGRFIEINQSFCEMLGYPADELVTLGFQQFTHEDDLEKDLGNLAEMLEGTRESYQMEKRYIHRSGEIVWAHLSVSCVRDGDGRVKYFISQVQNITQRKHYEARVIEMAYRDELTGLYNRRHFLECASDRLEGDEGLSALLFIDLNGFKTINDSHGHLVGDELLQHVARRLERTLRRDDMLGRLGGDEFIILLTQVTRPVAQMVADRIKQSFAAPFMLSSGPVSLGASIGLSFALSELDVQTLLQQADLAMYQAKRNKHEGTSVIEFALPSSDALLN